MSSAKIKTAVLVAGFGGPASREEVRPFVRSVLSGTNVPEARVEKVVAQYETIGNVSPYKPAAERLAAELSARLAAQGVDWPVRCAYRHSEPSFDRALEELLREGFTRVVAFVLSAFPGESATGKYRIALESAAQNIPSPPEILRVDSYSAEPLFVRAQARLLAAALESLSPDERAAASILFCAHSIRSAESGRDGYERELRNAAARVANEAGIRDWTLAFQSRSGRPGEPWLEPDIAETVKNLPGGRRAAVLVPIGFACENVELAYDLDVLARRAAEERGVAYRRALAAAAAPEFAEMAASLVLAADRRP